MRCSLSVKTIVFRISLAVFGSFFLLCPLFVFNSAQATTGINKVINFQGKVVNSDGTNVSDGTYSFVFKIYNGPGSTASNTYTEDWTKSGLFSSTISSLTVTTIADGNIVYPSAASNQSTLAVGQILTDVTKGESTYITSVNTGTQTITVAATPSTWSTSDTITNQIYVKNGIFRASIGSLTAISGVDFNSTSIYLGVNFNGDGEMKPRIQYTASPYAFNSSQLEGGTWESPGAIGSTTPNSGAFTTLNGQSVTISNTGNALVLSGAGANIQFSGAGLAQITTASNQNLGLVPGGSGNIGLGTNSPVDPVSLGASINASATHALLNLSNTALVSGSSNGTYIGVNPASFTGNFFDFQVNGTSVAKLTSAGALTVSSCTGCGGGGGSSAWSALTAPTANLSLAMGNYTTALNYDSFTGGSSTYGFSLSSTSTSWTSGGALGYINWNPGSATTSTGDLLDLNVGSNGTLANIFNISNAGSSVFSVSQTAVTSNLPLNLTSPGDVAMSYDLNFTNPTASYVKSQAPLYLQSGESFNSSDLNLTTFNSGHIITNTQALVTNGSASVSGQLVLGTLTPNSSNIGGLYATNGSTYGKALAIFDQYENQDILTASDSGTTRFTLAKNGNITDTSATAVNFSGAALTVSSCTGCGGGTSSQWTTSGSNIYYTTGNVGIGTTSPAEALSVSGNIKLVSSGNGIKFADGTVMTTAAATSTGDSSTTDLNMAADSDSNGSGTIYFLTHGTERMRVGNDGSILFQSPMIASIGTGASGNGSNAVFNVMGDQGSLIPNSGFESNQLGGFADGWFAAATNSATITHDTTTSNKGNASVKIVFTNTSTAIYSSCIPVSGTAGSYALDWYAKKTGTPTPTVRAYMDGYTSEANCQSDTSASVTAPASTSSITTSWAKYGLTTGNAGIANNQTWARVHFFIACTINCTNATVNLDGVRFIQTTGYQGLDLAENYPVSSQNMPQPGDVVMLDSTRGVAFVKKADNAGDSSVIGVVSTNPGEVLDDGTVPDPKVPVALAGRVPTNVSTKNGVIHVGDYLMSSDIPGVAVKATSAGQVIGTAMQEDLTTDPAAVSQITMFIKNTYYAGPSVASGLSGDATNLTQFINTDANGNYGLAMNTFTAQRVNAGLEIDTQKLVAQDIDVTNLHADHIDRLDALTARVASLEAVLAASTSAMPQSVASGSPDLATPSAWFTTMASATALLDPMTPVGSGSGNLSGLTVDGSATVSGDLRVKGNGMVEGMFNVIDTLTTNNVVVSGLAEFFDRVVFHKDVTVQGHLTVSNDSAGFVTMKKGQRTVSVQFATPYDTEPVVNIDLQPSALDSAVVLHANYSYVVTTNATKGFTITINKSATQDLRFSWMVLGNSEEESNSSDSVRNVTTSASKEVSN